MDCEGPFISTCTYQAPTRTYIQELTVEQSRSLWKTSLASSALLSTAMEEYACLGCTIVSSTSVKTNFGWSNYIPTLKIIKNKPETTPSKFSLPVRMQSYQEFGLKRLDQRSISIFVLNFFANKSKYCLCTQVQVY